MPCSLLALCSAGSPLQREQCTHSSGRDLSVTYLLTEVRSCSHEVICIAPTLYLVPRDNNRLSWSRYLEDILCCNYASVSCSEHGGREGVLEKGQRSADPSEMMFTIIVTQLHFQNSLFIVMDERMSRPQLRQCHLSQQSCHLHFYKSLLKITMRNCIQKPYCELDFIN